jgi:hypothetical protein
MYDKQSILVAVDILELIMRKETIEVRLMEDPQYEPGVDRPPKVCQAH